MYNNNSNEFLNKLDYDLDSMKNLQCKCNDLSNLNDEQEQINDNLNKKLNDLDELKLNASENIETKFNEASKAYLKSLQEKTSLGFLAILLISTTIFTIEIIFFHTYNIIEKIIVVILFAIFIYLSFVISNIFSITIGKFIILLYKHTNKYKKYTKSLLEQIRIELEKEILILDQDIKTEKQILLKKASEINECKSYIDFIKTQLNNSIFSNEYKKYWEIIHCKYKSPNLIGFSKLTGIYDLDPLVFAYNSFAGKNLKFDNIESKESLFTENEFIVYQTLLEVTQSYYPSCNVFGSVRLIDFFKPIKDNDIEKNKELESIKNFIINKQIDFVLVSNTDNKVKLLIELDDKSHFENDRIKRDFYINILLSKKGYKLLRINNDGNLNAESLYAKIEMALNSTQNVIYDYSKEFESQYRETLHKYVMNLV